MSKTHDFKEKMAKKFPSFVESIQGLDIADLEKHMLIYSKHREDTELAKKLDQELQEAKDKAASLAAPYSDAIKVLKMKMAYLNILIREINGEK